MSGTPATRHRGCESASRGRQVARAAITMAFYHGPVSDHFDGEHFYNSPNSGMPHGGGSVRPKWLANREPGPWPKWIDAALGLPPPERVSDGGLRATFVGHSTVLIQMDGVNILCDPIWSKRASPVSFAGPRRHRAPGIRFEQLPPIDLVLQSHDHYDHFDVPTLRRIASQWRPGFGVPLGVARRLLSKGIANAEQIRELDWWQSAEAFDKVRITAVPARHFSGRSLRDRNKTLWCGYVIEGYSGAVYFPVIRLRFAFWRNCGTLSADSFGVFADYRTPTGGLVPSGRYTFLRRMRCARTRKWARQRASPFTSALFTWRTTARMHGGRVAARSRCSQDGAPGFGSSTRAREGTFPDP